MFNVDETTKRITMHRGDTGSVRYHLTGYEFQADDRVLWTMKSENGTIVKQGIYTPVDGDVVVEFANADTDQLSPGQYPYDLRVIANPEYDQGGAIIDGDIVSTPVSPMYVQILSTVGQI